VVFHRNHGRNHPSVSTDGQRAESFKGYDTQQERLEAEAGVRPQL
jgi:hypothetical protein